MGQGEEKCSRIDQKKTTHKKTTNNHLNIIAYLKNYLDSSPLIQTNKITMKGVILSPLGHYHQLFKCISLKAQGYMFDVFKFGML